MSQAHPKPDPETEARRLVGRLGGRWTGNGGLCHCPAHDDRTPSLSVRAGRTRLLIHCFAGCSAVEILAALRSGNLLERGARTDAAIGPDRTCAQLRGAALRLWGAARPLAGTPAERYLAGRGLVECSDELRFLARTPDGPRPLTRFRPALIAAVRDDDGLAGIHRTFLARDEAGNAFLRSRGGLGGFGRGAVRLGGGGTRLGLAEGIETALSATALFGVPCWAALGTERFGLVALPGAVSELLLFLDNDAGGRRAGLLARAAHPDIPSIRSFWPMRAGDDWNDVLMARRPAALGAGRRGGG